MSYSHDYRQWPFLTQEEFELACAYFDQRYVKASLGLTRQILKIRERRTLTTGKTYLEILRLLELSNDDDGLSSALAKLGARFSHETDAAIELTDDDTDEESLRPDHNKTTPVIGIDNLPQYSIYSHQPYVTYEIHLHPTYSMPTLWFTLHDLPMGEPTFDINAVYRYLVPHLLKDQMRTAGMMGGISAAPHPVTDIPAFFVHPCQTKEAMENFDCPLTDYIMVWLGLVGGCVGLWTPPEMAHSTIDQVN